MLKGKRSLCTFWDGVVCYCDGFDNSNVTSALLNTITIRISRFFNLDHYALLVEGLYMLLCHYIVKAKFNTSTDCSQFIFSSVKKTIKE